LVTRNVCDVADGVVRLEVSGIVSMADALDGYRDVCEAAQANPSAGVLVDLRCAVFSLATLEHILIFEWAGCGCGRPPLCILLDQSVMTDRIRALPWRAALAGFIAGVFCDEFRATRYLSRQMRIASLRR
jgi:hypothetical protein